MGDKYSILENKWVSESDYIDKGVYQKVSENIGFIKKILGNSIDLETRELVLENDFQKIELGISFISNISDIDIINKSILEMVYTNFHRLKEKISQKELIKFFKNNLLAVSEVVLEEKYGEIINKLLNGDTVIFFENYKEVIAIGSKGYKERAIEKPTNHISVKGSKDSFTESLATNISLVRRRMRNPNLWVKKYVIGKKSNTNVALLYINGITDQKLIDEFEKRINNEKIENIVDSSYLKGYLREKSPSLFPLMYDTERPDSVMGNLYEGRIVVLVDGSPYAIIAPTTFFHFLSSPEDYYNKSIIGSAFRIIRYIAMFLAIFLPSFYMCVIKFHSEILPINLLYSIMGQRTKVPLPAGYEIILTLFAFDLLTEAGTRMPMMVGNALSFVGAIVIGQSAVEADLISSMMLIIVAVNGIGTLTIPDYDMGLSVKLVRYFLLIFAMLFGFTGLTIATVILLVHLTSLRSFGMGYLYPVAPFAKKGLLDTILVSPVGKMFKRNKEIKRKGENNAKN